MGKIFQYIPLRIFFNDHHSFFYLPLYKSITQLILWGQKTISKKMAAEISFRFSVPLHDYFFQPVQMAPIRFSYKPRDLPREFDSRAKWPNLNSNILDQGWCGASWAFSTASVASDRFLIDSKGKTDEKLCPRSIIACNTHGQSGCNGGSVDRAWSYLRKYG